MTADMRAHGVGREMKDKGDVPGGLAFHTEVIDCNFVLRFHKNSFLCGGRATEMATLPIVSYALISSDLTASGRTSFASIRSEVMYATCPVSA